MPKHPSLAGNCSECGQALLDFDFKAQLADANAHIAVLEEAADRLAEALKSLEWDYEGQWCYECEGRKLEDGIKIHDESCSIGAALDAHRSINAIP